MTKIVGMSIPFLPKSRVIDSWLVKKKKKENKERLYKKVASFPLLKRYVFYPIDIFLFLMK